VPTSTTTTTPAPTVVLPITSITPGALSPRVRQGTIRKRSARPVGPPRCGRRRVIRMR
jgi:hypothetical protein